MKLNIIVLTFLFSLLSLFSLFPTLLPRTCYAHDKNPQSINLKSVGNARELGGYSTVDGRKVRHGILLRTAELNKISSEDIARLKEVYNLSVIADLRMSIEAAPKPDPVIDGVKYRNLRVIDEELFNRELEEKLKFEGNAFERLKLTVESGLAGYDLYINFLNSDYGKKAYREFFHELLNLPPNKSILFHCTQGKDRTGCAAMLILSALGASEDIIMSDYMLTNEYNADIIASQRKKLLSQGIEGEKLEKYMIVFDEVNPKTMKNVLSWLKEDYGSPVGYIIKELGITQNEIEKLKSKFLE